MNCYSNEQIAKCRMEYHLKVSEIYKKYSNTELTNDVIDLINAEVESLEQTAINKVFLLDEEVKYDLSLIYNFLKNDSNNPVDVFKYVYEDGQYHISNSIAHVLTNKFLGNVVDDIDDEYRLYIDSDSYDFIKYAVDKAPSYIKQITEIPGHVEYNGYGTINFKYNNYKL